MDAPFPSSGSMDAWQEKRGLQTMNLRSVFTVEQQRVLERYYDNGMTNQSKSCFQLILQCAQETKLDFSVVRTWVGNKRRKLASRVDQNGDISFSNHGLPGGPLSNHTLPRGPLSNPTLAGGALSNHRLAGGALVAGAMLTAEMAAARSIQRGSHLLPPSSSFPSSSSSSSSPSSSSPLSCGNINNNNNDVILTGIYSLNSASRSRTLPKPPLSRSDPELPAHAHQTLPNQSLHNRNTSSSSPLHSRLASLQRMPSSVSGPPVYSLSRRTGFSPREAGTGAGTGGVPRSWARQYGPVQPRPWPSPSQPQPRPHSNPQPPPAPPKAHVSPPNPNPSIQSEQNLCIQQVFTLSDRGEGEGLGQGHASIKRSQERQMPHHMDTAIGCFSIAMETGDEEDEWGREEELANMASQTHRDAQRGRTSSSLSPPRGEVSGGRGGGHTDPPCASSRPGSYLGNSALHGSYSLTALQTSPTGAASLQVPVSLTAPWLISNSRKRTLQDRTQFSDADLVQLKRYWDRGMTSLGSVCREKITAAANQLSVDTEIVKTWIGNRRRKFRLMGIEIPPPKGGPAVFATSSLGGESPSAVSPEGEGLRTPELGDDLNDGGSLCLSEDGTSDSYQREGEDVTEEINSAPLADNVKIEIIDEDEDDDGVEIMASDMEHMQNLLEFKHEEVQFLESELENQKQKYYELESFTKSLLNAVRNNDQEKQQELLASLPQPADQDWDMSPEDVVQPAAMTTHKSSNNNDSSSITASNDETSLVTLNKDLPLVDLNDDGSLARNLIESSASEEQGAETETGPE